MSAPTIVNVSSPAVAPNTTPTYGAQFVDQYDNPISAAALLSLTLSIADTLGGSIVNDCSQVDILNTGRGTVSATGYLTLVLETGDTALDVSPPNGAVQRSLIFDFTYSGYPSLMVGRHQANFFIQGLAGP